MKLRAFCGMAHGAICLDRTSAPWGYLRAVLKGHGEITHIGNSLCGDEPGLLERQADLSSSADSFVAAMAVSPMNQAASWPHRNRNLAGVKPIGRVVWLRFWL